MEAGSGLHRAGIALGSNVASRFGSPEETVRAAIARVGALGRVAAVSRLRVTKPEMYLEQPQFVNGAMLLETELGPEALMRALLEIEQAMGRVRTGVPPKGPRTIDLDLIFVDDVVMATEELTLPHPGMAERRFVLEPLREIAAEWRHPETGLTAGEMLGRLGVDLRMSVV